MSDRVALADAIGNASIERGARNATDTAMERNHPRQHRVRRGAPGRRGTMTVRAPQRANVAATIIHDAIEAYKSRHGLMRKIFVQAAATRDRKGQDQLRNGQSQRGGLAAHSRTCVGARRHACAAAHLGRYAMTVAENWLEYDRHQARPAEECRPGCLLWRHDREGPASSGRQAPADMPSRRVRPPKPPALLSRPPPANEQAEIETMLKRLEELRRAASNSELRAAYQAAIDGLDGVLYRLAMLRALRPPKRTPLSAAVSSPPPAPKAATPTRAAAARIVVARKPRRR